MNTLLLIAASLSLVLQAAASGGAPSVVLGNRSVVGRYTQHTKEFLGIPFGTYDVEYTAATMVTPPSSDPHNPNGAFNAQQFGACCRQPNVGLYIPKQSKECLNLNVFVPTVLKKKSVKPLPVLFWVYGGGGTTGCASQSNPALYNGTNLVANNDYKEDVIVVTINYRVNAFANLYLDALNAEDPKYNTSGHYGFQDVILALQWTQKYIGRFGGDPTRVTIFGESNGGNVVSTIGAYAGTDGLFHAFISESGTENVVTGFVNRSEGQAQGAAFMKILGCAPSNLTCLRSQPADNVLKVAGLSQFRTVVDGTMLPKYPFDLYATPGNQSFRRRPAMMGLNNPDNWPYCVGFPDANASLVIKALTQQIPLWSSIPAENVLGILKAYGVDKCVAPHCCNLASVLFRDMMMWCPARRTLAAKLNHTTSRGRHESQAQGYLFNLKCHPVCPENLGRFSGVCMHTAEIAFVFGTVSDYEADAQPNCTWSAEARNYSNTLIREWVSFASTGHPEAPEWTPYDTPGSHDAFTMDIEQRPFKMKQWNEGVRHAADKCDKIWDKWDARLSKASFG